MKTTHEHAPSAVSLHLQIDLAEYDARIRTFVPYYEEMLDVASDSFKHFAKPNSILLDLGIGTGALSGRCAEKCDDVRIVGIDADPEILKFAAERLGDDRADLRAGSFLDGELPRADFIVSSLALHHVSTIDEKLSLYRRCRAALEPGGAMIIADCFLPANENAAMAGFSMWREFLESTYSAGEAEKYLEAWGTEDTYFPLAHELSSLAEAAFEIDVVWRRDLFAVLVCRT